MRYRIQMVHDLIDETDIAWNMFLNYLKLSNYFKTYNMMDERERRYYNNKLCSDLAIICEKYCKALYLKSATIPQTIIDRLNLSDENVVNIIIGSDDPMTKTIYGKLTRDEKKEIQELKFQGISHNFTKLLNSDNSFLKNVHFYFNLSLQDLKNISDNELEDLMYSDKIYDAFVKGRYSSLNDYNADFDALITLCETLQKEIIKGESLFDLDCIEILTSCDLDLIHDFYNYKESINNHTSIIGGYQPRFRTIKHIYPSLESKIILNNHGTETTIGFGKYKFASLYKFEGSNGINKKIIRSVEELQKEIEQAPEHIGLYSTETTEAKNIIELNTVFNLSGISVKDSEFVVFRDDNGQHVIANINGQLISTNHDFIKEYNGDNKKIN